MNTPTPPPPAEPRGASATAIQPHLSPAPRDLPAKFRTHLRRYGWLALLTPLLGMGGACILILTQPPTYLSRATLVETAKLHLPDAPALTTDSPGWHSSHAELLQSKALSEMARARWKSAQPDQPNSLGKDPQPLPVRIRVQHSPGSSVVVIWAEGSAPAYVPAYLDALTGAYLEYRRNFHRMVSSDTLASISEQVLRAELELKSEQDTLREFERTNNYAALPAQEAVALECLKKLHCQLLDLRLEDLTPEHSAGTQPQASSSENTKRKTEYVQTAIKEWEVKLATLGDLTVEAERLKRNLQRTQSLYDRLQALLQNVGVERNITQATLAILEPASPAQRNRTHEKILLVRGGLVGLAVGIGMLGLLGIAGRRRKAPVETGGIQS